MRVRGEGCTRAECTFSASVKRDPWVEIRAEEGKRKNRGVISGDQGKKKKNRGWSFVEFHKTAYYSASICVELGSPNNV